MFSPNAGECAAGKKVNDANGEMLKKLEEKIAPLPHGNSTINAFDYNGDGVKDLILSEVGSLGLKVLINTGTNELAHITDQHLSFPNYNTPIDILYTPYVFFIDVDMDGKKDILASPQLANAENVTPIHYYKNTSTNNIPYFELQSTNFLNDNIIDFGTGTHPTIVDVNADGLLDLVIGNYGFFESNGGRDARLILCLNVGSLNNPIFEVTNYDWLNLSQRNEWYLTPTFADLDGDNDKDLVYGTALGNLFYAENIAEAGEVMQFAEIDSAWQEIHSFDFPIGQNTVPNFYDYDQDGLLDLVLGEKNGNINFFKNTGTTEAPFFNPNPQVADNTNFFGKVDMRKIGTTSGFSSPLFVELKNETKFLVGSSEIGTFEFTDFTSGINSQFTKSETPLLSDFYGRNLRVAVADLDNNGFADIICGHERGGISIFTTNWETETVENPTISINDLDNSLKTFVSSNFLNIENKELLQIKNYKIVNLKGQILLSNNKPFTEQHTQIDISTLSKGVYLIIIETNKGVFTNKFVW